MVLRLLLINGPRVRKQINCASMQKTTKCARQKVLKYLNYLRIEPYKQDKTKNPKKRYTHVHTNIKLPN